MPKKLDLKKQLKHLYQPRANQVELVDVPAARFLMLDGVVEPPATPETSPAFQEAFGALYGVAYTLKFMSKLRPTDPIDYTVMPPEGLWWTTGDTFDPTSREPWHWTLMILQPDHVTAAMVSEAVGRVKEKRETPALARLRFERFHEGRSVQAMHVGPYAEETRTIAKMEAFAEEQGYRFRGKHHEIYLGDPRRAKPEKLRTVLRHPVARAR